MSIASFQPDKTQNQPAYMATSYSTGISDIEMADLLSCPNMTYDRFSHGFAHTLDKSKNFKDKKAMRKIS